MPRSVTLPAPIRWANWLGHGLARCGLRSTLDAERILDHSRRKTGLEDFGPPDVAEPLRVLVDSLNQEANLSPFGRFVIREYLHRTLAKRLRLTRALREDPSLADPIERPIFIVGLPRTGTTMLHHLLSQAPGARALRTWELMASERDLFVGRPRLGGTWTQRRLINWIGRVNPELSTVHPLGIDRIEECTMLMMDSLLNQGFMLLGHMPSYAKWLFTTGQERLPDAYRLHRLWLNLYARGEINSHWVLKAPTHLVGLAALMEVYPTAQVLLTQRDPAEALPSTCSLFALTRRSFGDSVERGSLGRELGWTMGQAMRIALDDRERFADRVTVVPYRELVDDPRGTIRRLYARLGRTFEPEFEWGIDRWLAANPRHKHGVHRYTAEEFGLDMVEWQGEFGEVYETLFAASETTRS